MANDHSDTPHFSVEPASAEAERLRRLAEETREVRDQGREAAEVARQVVERARGAAEAARTTAEEARVAAEAARDEAMSAIMVTAETFEVALEHMKKVEELRRELRDLPDPSTLDAN